MEALPQAPPFTAVSPERSSITPHTTPFHQQLCVTHQVSILAPWGELERGFHKQQQRCRCYVSPAQACGRKHATLGTRPPHHHGNAVSVALSRRRYPQWANNQKISVSDRISLQKILVLGHKSIKKILVSDHILP